MKDVDILAIGAHPDDVELSCGGTIAKAVGQGYRVAILDLTEGEMGTRGNREIRRREAEAAAHILGVDVRENLGLPDGGFEVNAANRLKVIAVYRKLRPRVVLIPHWLERHPDHVHAHHLCREAIFYSGLRKIVTRSKGIRQEPWRPHICFHFMQKHEFIPSFIVDVTSTYEKRMEAIRAHKSQFHDPESKEPETYLSRKTFFDFLEVRARDFGEKIGVRYGEPFYSIEPIGISDLFSLKVFKG